MGVDARTAAPADTGAEPKAGRQLAEILPTQSGFFFGSTEYDEGYRDDLEDTKRKLEAILAEDGADQADYAYRSSW